MQRMPVALSSKSKFTNFYVNAGWDQSAKFNSTSNSGYIMVALSKKY